MKKYLLQFTLQLIMMKPLLEGDHFWMFLQAAHEELIKFDYKLYTVIYNNAIFISNDLNIKFPDLTLQNSTKSDTLTNQIEKKSFLTTMMLTFF